MVIGPNGTGKSTIACAIAIGLGFNASVRAGLALGLSALLNVSQSKGTWSLVQDVTIRQDGLRSERRGLG